MQNLPKKYLSSDREAFWKDQWDQDRIYAWKPDSRENTFSVDTPPPTVSGSLHIGHVFSYTHTDILARFMRMSGKSVFYPMGWDDNGLPTERRVQQVYGITCDPSIAYDLDWKPDQSHKRKPHEYLAVSRQNFIETCQLLTAEDERVFEHLWRRLGLSVDWELTYSTIGAGCRQKSQHSFLDFYHKGLVKQVKSPTMWDTDFQTAVAQAEVEDREKPGAYHDLVFKVDDGAEFVIATTRPELLPACIAVVAHPDDQRYQSYFGKTAISPLFHAPVPIRPSTHADPEKGTGILMVCTFGDAADVEWWKQSGLAVKPVLDKQGKLLNVTFGTAPFDSSDIKCANQAMGSLAGLRIKKARQVIVELLDRAGALKHEPRGMMHPVKFYEKGDSPLEFMTTRQWFISILDHKDALLKQGDQIQWHPAHMKSRYTHWVEGLNQDWCISRQRFFGVPFPVWYPVNEQNEPQYEAPIFASVVQLPVDPSIDTPEGFDAADRGKSGGFVADPDVMDTWATSSLTPQIVGGWGEDGSRLDSVYPMDVRPQSHEIIRTWAFYTIVKSWVHHRSVPWYHVLISGWVLDPDRKKMSKSKGNVITPEHLFDQYCADAIRYWAAKARLGTDTACDESVFSVGQKLVTKIFNASKFVLMQCDSMEGSYQKEDIISPVDCSYMAQLKEGMVRYQDAFLAQDHATALDVIESAFWRFCDHYIELVKVRAYRSEDEALRRSALATLYHSLLVFLQGFAPFLPFITEEVWAHTHETGSVHQSRFKDIVVSKECSRGEFDMAITVLSEIRAAKSVAQKNMKYPVKRLVIHANQLSLQHLNDVVEDLMYAGSVESKIQTHLTQSHDVVVDVELA